MDSVREMKMAVRLKWGVIANHVSERPRVNRTPVEPARNRHPAPHLPAAPTLGQVGEAATISVIREVAPSDVNGDDAAVLTSSAPYHRTVASTDSLVEGRHFRLDWSTAYEVGYKAVVQNFADIEAMGARPRACLLSLCAPAQTPVDTVRSLAQGLAAACGHYSAELVGGDVTRANELVVTVTALGELGGAWPALTLSRARPGQYVLAHGRIGHSGAGLALLERFGRSLPPQYADLQPLIDAHCAPWIKPGRGVIARAAGATAMTDNSDGLVVDVGAIARASRVGIELEAAALSPGPLLVRAGRVLGLDPWSWVLSGGEDHTLVATADHANVSDFRVIGRVVRTPGVRVEGAAPAYTGGWNSFG
ncbi:thiamine-phosphate kinase [Corynebacterium lizhenjunii]|uniref:thiamine-phosphate kinase n=1 Tax=Corynebacterium lizhenjunii TaxID=2709394 RepID=UPI0013ED6E4C|nr:thiamine-phosphate kinase [Corynebacterium lizhenjunii]